MPNSVPIAPNKPSQIDNGFLFDLQEAENLKYIVSNLIEENHPLQRLRLSNIERVKEDGLFEENIEATIVSMRELIANRK